MRLLIHTAVLILSMGLAAHAQVNLVRNWSFEDLKPNINGEIFCPSSGGQMSCISSWNSAHGSVDYFNACSNEEWPLWGVPINLYGCQRPYEGLAYVLLAGYVEMWSGVNPREFVFQELEEPLTAGSLYRWSAWVSLADSMNFAQSGLGAVFTATNTQYWDIEDFMSCTPNVINELDRILDDKVGWTKVDGEFIAHGGEKFMSIGLFRSDTSDNIQQVSSFPVGQYTWDVSGYYLDAVELYEISGVGVEEQETAKFELYPNPTAGPTALQYNTADQGPLQWQVCDMAGRTVHTQMLQGTQGRATLGTALPSGVYVSNVTANGVRIGSTRLVVL